MLYGIYHPEDGSLNLDCEEMVEYRCVAAVQADSLEEAYCKAQNHNWAYTSFNVRSTCEGDLIAMNDIMFMVLGHGFGIHGFFQQPV